MDALVRIARESDAPAACAVLRRSIAECCAADHLGDPDLIQPWLSNKTPENVLQWISAESTYAVVAESKSEVVGVAMLLESGEITLCYLLPEVRFKGNGKQLLAALEKQARRLELGSIRLHSTKTAHEFYRRNGFKDSGSSELWHGIESFPMSKLLKAQ